VRSLWSDSEAQELLDKLAPTWGEEMALRVYTSRLIGRDPDLVMHGGGNTSLKGTVKPLVGDDVEALFIKGSGWNLDTIEPPGLPAVDLGRLRALRSLDTLSDLEMVNQLRTNLFEAGAPNPSVETLLHAFLPHRFIDHTHADITLVATNQPAGVATQIVADAFGSGWGVVPYVMPGFALAKLAGEVFDADPTVEGLVMLNHGLFTFADDARTAYERMTEAVDRAERLVARMRKENARVQVAVSTDLAATQARIARLAPLLRRALTERNDDDAARWILEHRGATDVLEALARDDAAALACEHPLTPDHVIRTKGQHLFLADLPFDDDDALVTRLDEAVADYRRRYEAYFAANRDRADGTLTRLDTTPRVLLVPGLGIFAAGRSKTEARIAADIAEHTVRAKALANDIGRYVALSDGDLFDMEYWILEQAKLGKKTPLPLAGQVALVTGALGAIGFGICRKLIDAGAHVALADLDGARLDEACRSLDPGAAGRATGIVIDVTDENAVRHGLDELCRVYGGLDLLVLNAGIAHVDRLTELDSAALRRVMEVNFHGYFTVLREGARLMTRQATGGNVIVNSSKNVFAPGADFGAYSASKAAGHQLAKVAALELAPAGIRVNLINADGVFGAGDRPSGLWREIGPARARSRGLEPGELQEFYRKRNLLSVAVTPEHVGNAVVFFATNQTPTTGATLPVDGGIPEAFPR
jgi:rhamnose utilization protein RhaD (predicted bifunctional aldolase and dehydrogenase)/NAD(P)-dependent dehydrogenase (short-subunit alcohol dehydrogenase family)